MSDDSRGRVLVIDDDESIERLVEAMLSHQGFEVSRCGDYTQAKARALEAQVEVVMVDLHLAEQSGLDVLDAVKQAKPEVEVIVMTGDATARNAMAAVKRGAWDVVTKPFESFADVAATVGKAADRCRLRRHASELERLVMAPRPDALVGESESMLEVFRLIERVSRSSSTVLITGESGTGKELVANAIHKRSARARSAFVAVNCSALTPTLLESELFGHVKGSFTGATKNKRGLFEAAHGGTLFLDEIGDMPLATQVHLLRALQEGEVRPVGSTSSVKVDVRVIAATNAELKRAIAAGRFREDLFYRINVVAIPLPALRTRPDDVPRLAQHFLTDAAQRSRKLISRFSPEALRLLVNAPWPGNVRELQNVVERAVVLAQGDEIGPELLPPTLTAPPPAPPVDDAPLVPLHDARRAFERDYVARALRAAGGDVSAAAVLAGVDASVFKKLVKVARAVDNPVDAPRALAS
ncbi:MAG: sigma-54-dependent Fis family transcriptional regulator [Myxococcaceae bacterium]|nr:sigma-54-dependent Fis family transcriptional regulator [Myxococcaceae bacterium]